MNHPDPELSLFAPAGVPAGPVEQAMTASLDAYRAAGVVVSRVSAASLLAQAHAVDLAIRARRPTNVSGANRVLLEMMTGLGLIDRSAPATTDPLDKLIAGILAEEDQPAGRPEE